MTLAEQLGEYVRACFTGIWIESHEHPDALAEIAQLCRQEDWKLLTWDIDQGLQGDEAEIGNRDPLAAIRAVNSLAMPDGTVLLVLQNFHRFLSSAEIVQTLAQQVITGKQNRTILVILSPVVQLPVELEKLFAVLEHELPDRNQLEEIARGIATEESELPADPELEVVLDAASGLTRLEAENAFSLSLVRQGRITSEAVWELKSGMLKKSGLLELHRGREDFNSLGGLEPLKDFCRKSLSWRNRSHPRKRPRGVLLLGVPGTGKSAFAKALGNETGRPTLLLDVGALMGSLVGQTESNIRQALRIADAMAPCILFCDEIEKGLSGVSGSNDSGVSARLFGRLLSWMNDHTSDVYLIATCNDISRLPLEFTRAERFDGLFFLDVPGADEKRSIWNLYLQEFERDPQQPLPPDDQWTGAEIRACCRLSALQDLSLLEAARNIVPVAVTAAESVSRLRQWAQGRCLSVNEPGIYQAPPAVSRPRRKVRRDSSSFN
ncbi:MAG TPA: AAA family ATPase [Planctomicrobium sp.]|nr:AAA family ATPase [Planctomicrobium sp.]